MEYYEYVDRLGQRMVTKLYEGIHYPEMIPGDVKSHLDQLNQIRFHPSDVLIASFPRSGTNWVYEIVYMLMTNKLEYMAGTMNTIEAFPPTILTSLPPPRLLHTHMYPQHCPKLYMDDKFRVICVYRNPKDVFVSLYELSRRAVLKAEVGTKMYDGEWSDFLELMYSEKGTYNSWFTHTRAWYEHLKKAFQPYIMVCYEDLQKDMLKEIKRLAAFLGTENSEEFLEKVADKCHFDKMAEFKRKHVPDYIRSMSRDGKSNIFFRKGKTNDWKDMMTVAQNERFNEIYRSKMLGIDLNITL